MITKTLGDKKFGWIRSAFRGKGYWYLLDEEGAIVIVASKEQFSKLGTPTPSEIEADYKLERENNTVSNSDDSFLNISGRVLQRIGGKHDNNTIGGVIGRGLFALGKMLAKKDSKIKHEYSKITSTENTPVRSGDSITDIGTKIYNLIDKNYARSVVQNQFKKNFEEELNNKRNKRNEELIKALSKPSKKEEKKVEKKVEEKKKPAEKKEEKKAEEKKKPAEKKKEEEKKETESKKDTDKEQRRAKREEDAREANRKKREEQDKKEAEVKRKEERDRRDAEETKQKNEAQQRERNRQKEDEKQRDLAKKREDAAKDREAKAKKDEESAREREAKARNEKNEARQKEDAAKKETEAAKEKQREAKREADAAKQREEQARKDATKKDADAAAKQREIDAKKEAEELRKKEVQAKREADAAKEKEKELTKQKEVAKEKEKTAKKEAEAAKQKELDAAKEKALQREKELARQKELEKQREAEAKAEKELAQQRKIAREKEIELEKQRASEATKEAAKPKAEPVQKKPVDTAKPVEAPKPSAEPIKPVEVPKIPSAAKIPPPAALAAAPFLAGAVIDVKFMDGMEKLATKYNTSTFDLLTFMMNESQMKPDARNKDTNASGLIQIMPSTLKAMQGLDLPSVKNIKTVDDIRKLSAAQQIPLIDDYFKMQGLDKSAAKAKSAGRKVDLATLYAVVFLPKYKDSPNETVIGVKAGHKGPNGETADDIIAKGKNGHNLTRGSVYKANNSFDKKGRGFFTKADIGIKAAGFGAQVSEALAYAEKVTGRKTVSSAPGKGDKVAAASIENRDMTGAYSSNQPIVVAQNTTNVTALPADVKVLSGKTKDSSTLIDRARS